MFVNTRQRFSLALAAVLAALVLALAGCGGTATAPQTDEQAPAAEGSAVADDARISVAVTVDGSAAEGDVIETTVDLPEGATAFDALMMAGVEVESQDSDYGIYVSSVNGLAAGDNGEYSGWLYAVNGEDGMVAADECLLADGDEVRWYYITEFSE